MRKSINLVSGKKSVNNLFKRLLVASFGVFLVTVVMCMGLIAYQLILKSTYDALESEEQQLNSTLLTLVEKRDKVMEIKFRLVEIKKLIGARAPVTARIQTLSELVPAASTVTSIVGTDIDLMLTLETEDLSSVNELVELKVAEVAQDKQRGIKRVEMRSFGLDPRTLLYNVSFGIEFI